MAIMKKEGKWKDELYCSVFCALPARVDGVPLGSAPGMNLALWLSAELFIVVPRRATRIR